MATSATLVAVTKIMEEAKKIMDHSIINEIFNPQAFIEPNTPIRAITNGQANWNPIRPEMAATVGEITPESQKLFCNLNFSEIDKNRQAIALTSQGKLSLEYLLISNNLRIQAPKS